MSQVCDELNQLEGLPPDLEFIVMFTTQEILLRKKIQLPLVVASRLDIEKGIAKDLATRAVGYVIGFSPSFDREQAAKELTEEKKRIEESDERRATMLQGGVGGASIRQWVR